MKTLTTVLAIALLALPACSKDDKDKKGSGKKGGGGGGAVTLATVTDATLGYSISIPKGAKTLQKDKMSGHTYSLPLPGGMLEYNIHITAMGAKDMASFVRMATMIGQKKIEKKEKTATGMLLVKAPRGVLQEVQFTTGGKLTVKCSGPAKGKALLVKMCSSLKATK